MLLKIVLTFCFTFALWTSVYGHIYSMYGDWTAESKDCYRQDLGCRRKNVLVIGVNQQLRDAISYNTSVKAHVKIILDKESTRNRTSSVMVLDNWKNEDGKLKFIGLWIPLHYTSTIGMAAVIAMLHVSETREFRLEYASCALSTSWPCIGLTVLIHRLEFEV